MATHITFASWSEFRAEAERLMDRRHDAHHIYYHAPMDRFPRAVQVLQIFANGKVKIRAGELRFTIDASHLDRLSRSSFAWRSFNAS